MLRSLPSVRYLPLTCALVFACTGTHSLRAADLYVSPQGKGNAPDSKSLSLRTIAQAQEVARRLLNRDSAGEPITVHIGSGEYFLDQPLRFTTADSGTPDNPVRYVAAKNAKVILLGGKRLYASDCQRVTEPMASRVHPAARGKLVAVDLSMQNVKHGERWPDSVADGDLDLLELFFDGKRLPLARYPNEGFMTMKRVLKTGSHNPPEPGVFQYRDTRHNAWRTAIEDGLWLKGFWRVPWQSEYVRIARMDTDRQTITHAMPVNGGIGSKYARPHGDGKEPYLAVNLIEEIDQPGEWCIHFDSRTLYLWPPSDVNRASIILSDIDHPMIEVDGASHVEFSGLTIEGRLGNGIEIRGGTSVLVRDCTVRNIGRDGVVIHGGTSHRVEDCHLYQLGAQGVYVDGGHRRRLISCDHVIENNHIHHFARTKRIYAAGINVGYRRSYGDNPDCVGVTLRHNLIHHTPHVGVLYTGNNHLFELNEIHHVAMVSNDMGGFYTVNDWTSRGNVLRFNFVHSSPHAEGIYCDDGDSGDAIYENVFFRIRTGVFIGGGHDNLVDRNVALHCERALFIDARGVSRNYSPTNRRMVDRVQSAAPDQSPWRAAYPQLATLLDQHPELPTGTRFRANEAINCERMIVSKASQEQLRFTTIEDNRNTTMDPVETLGDAKSIISQHTSIPLESIGLKR